MGEGDDLLSGGVCGRVLLERWGAAQDEDLVGVPDGAGGGGECQSVPAYPVLGRFARVAVEVQEVDGAVDSGGRASRAWRAAMLAACRRVASALGVPVVLRVPSGLSLVVMRGLSFFATVLFVLAGDGGWGSGKLAAGRTSVRRRLIIARCLVSALSGMQCSCCFVLG